MKVEKIVVHCSDSRYGNAALIDEWHRDRGFERRYAFAKDSDLKHIGYHYVIENGIPAALTDFDPEHDGLVTIGRDEEETGAHAYGLNNRSIGVCLIGKHKFTDAQFRSLHGVCQTLLTKYELGPVDIIGHRDTPHEISQEASRRKTCPNFDVGKWKAGIEWIF